MRQKSKSICFMTCANINSNMVVQVRHARAMAQAGYIVYMIISDNSKPKVEDGIHYVPAGISFSSTSYLKRFFVLSRKIEKIAVQIDADIYQTETPDFLSVCLKLKRKGKKVYYNMLEGHPYTLYNKLHLPKFLSGIIVKMMVARMRRQLMKIDYVFAVSDDIMDYLTDWGIENKVLLGNYPEVNKDFSLSREEYLAKEPRAIYYGHIPVESRQELVFDALSKIPEVHYTLAGKFWNKSYEAFLSSHPYWPNVEFINGFERNELSQILSRCTISNVARDLSKSKSPNGSLGILKIFESMEAALPLVLPNLPVYREMVAKYNCGVLVDINDSSSIENGIRTLISDREKAYLMGQNGRKAVLEEYSWDIVSKLYLNIITS